MPRPGHIVVELVGGLLCGERREVPKEDLVQTMQFSSQTLQVRAAAKHKLAHTTADLERPTIPYRFVCVWPARGDTPFNIVEYWPADSFPVPSWKIAAKDR